MFSKAERIGGVCVCVSVCLPHVGLVVLKHLTV